MSESSCVRLETEGLVATITIDRPQALNALNMEVLERLSAVLEELSQKSLAELRVVLLRGAGEKAFVAGADIKLMQGASALELRGFAELGQRVARQIEGLEQVVISVVDGFAIGGGLELALATDLIVASSKAKVGQAEVSLGLIPGFGGTQRLALRTGVGHARRLIFTGMNIGAEEAHRIGLVDWLAAPEEVESVVDEVVGTLLSKGPVALAAGKRAMQNTHKLQLLSGLQQEVDEFLGLFNYEDTREGLSAFVEKRKAEFRGE